MMLSGFAFHPSSSSPRLFPGAPVPAARSVHWVCRLVVVPNDPPASRAVPSRPSCPAAFAGRSGAASWIFRPALLSRSFAAGRKVLELARSRILRSPARLEPASGRSTPYSCAQDQPSVGIDLFSARVNFCFFK